MSEMTHFRLASSGLLSKWGFNDGDDPDDLLDYLDAKGLPYPDDWDVILKQLVREYLLPALDQDVTVVEVETCHNPIRAETVDGVDVVDSWRDNHPPVTLTPAEVLVPIADVLALIHPRVSGEGRDG